MSKFKAKKSKFNTVQNLIRFLDDVTPLQLRCSIFIRTSERGYIHTQLLATEQSETHQKSKFRTRTAMGRA